MANLRKCMDIAMLNVGDLTMMSDAGLLARVSGGVNIVYKQKHHEPSPLVEGYTTKQVAIAMLIIRCLTLLSKTDTHINVDELIDRVSEIEGIY